jgi:hypothetical protein
MDMTESDDKRVEDFLRHHKREVPDQGFTRRVMRRLPQRAGAGSVLAGAAWAAIAVAFCLHDGLHAVEHVVLKGQMTLGYECVYSFSWTAVGMVVLAMVGVIGYYGFYAED